MSAINRHTFLTELGKLLTFMYEEDRQLALSMYERIFDEAGNDDQVMQILMSPTRQAVTIARTYNAKESKAAGRKSGGSSSELPEFVNAICELRYDILEAVTPADVPATTMEQVSLFSDYSEPDTLEEKSLGIADEIPDAYKAPQEEEEVFQQSSLFTLDDDAADSAVIEKEEPSAPDFQETVPAEEENDDVDRFIQSFSTPKKSDDFIMDAGDSEDAPVMKIVSQEVQEEAEEESIPEAEEIPTIRKAKVPLLILYILCAIPITLLGIGILLIPAVLFLAIAAALIACGFTALMTAFGTFTVFADIMVVLGCSLILIALGILALWLFVWFIGGAIVGLIGGVVQLGGKWCYKEVQAE